MDETERHELREAAGLGLNLPEQIQLTDPVVGSFPMSVHHCRGAGDAARVRGADHFLPIAPSKVCCAKARGVFVVENLGGCSRQRVESLSRSIAR